MSEIFSPYMTLVTLAAAVATYLTRIGGHLVISRMKEVPPRLEAALNAVPAAVLTTLVAPAFYAGGTDVKIAMAAALVAGLRFQPMQMLLVGWAVVMTLRYLVN